MSRNDPLILLRHMLDYAAEAVAMAEGQSVNVLLEKRQLALALTPGNAALPTVTASSQLRGQSRFRS